MALLQCAAVGRLMAAAASAAAGAAGSQQSAAAAAAAAVGRALQTRLQAAAAAAHAPHQQLQQRRGLAVVSGEDSHADFKPQYKEGPVSDVDDTIKADIAGHQVFIYMKGTPDAPQCGFSNMACRVLDAYNLQYGSRNVLADAGIREGIKKFTGWPTIPQVFVKGEFVGGSDILMEMHKAGELEALARELDGAGDSK